MLDIDVFIEKIKKKSRLLGVDPGNKRIGIAISDENKIVATPYTTIIKENYKDLISQLIKIVEEYEIDGIVIGNPINMDGSEGPSSQSAKDLAKNLSKDVTKNITLWDERLSTVAVTRTMIEADLSRARQKQVVDKIAAAFILQGALDYLQTIGDTSRNSA